MAVKATFEANFSNFLAAAKAAEGSLDKLAAASGVTEASVEKIGRAFKGESLIGNATRAVQAVSAIGGISSLTDTEVSKLSNQLNNAVAKMQRLGIVVPDEMQKMHAEASKAMSGISSSTNSMGSMFDGLGKSIMSTAAGFISAQVVIGGIKSAFAFASDAAIGMNATLEKSTLQFTTLMGDAQRAEKHVRDLFEFAKKTPFETGPIIAASKHMQTFGGDALNTMDNLTLLGDAAAATGAPIEDLGMWTGRLYAAIQGGRPFGEATARLMELGVLTPQVRSQMEELADTAGGGEQAFKLFQDSVSRFSGAMVSQANTWDGLTSSIKDAINITLADALLPFFETIKIGAQITLDALGSKGMAGAFESLKNSISGVFGKDGRELIIGLGSTLLAFGSGATIVAEGVYRAWSALKIVFASVASITNIAMLAVVSAFDKAFAAAASIPGIGDKFKPVADSIHLTKVAIESSQKSFHDMADAALSGAAGTDAFAQTMSATRESIAVFGEQLELSANKYKKSTEATNLNTKASQSSVVAINNQGKSSDEASSQVDRLTKSLTDQIAKNEQLKQSIEKVAATPDWFRLPKASLVEGQPIMSQTIEQTAEIARKTDEWVKKNLQVVPAMHSSSESLKKLGQSLGDTGKQTGIFGEIFGKLGPTILSAIQGGGDVGKSIGSMIGNSFGSFFSEKAASATSGFFSTKLGGVFEKMMPGLGALAGQLLGAGMSKAMGWIKGLFSDPLKKEIEAANAEIDKLKSKMLEQVGSVDQLEERYNAMGLSIREAFGGQGKQGLEALKAAQDEFNKRVEESKVKLDEMKGKLSSLQGELGGLISKAYEMGYVFNQQGELIGFNFDKVAQVAKDFGVDLSALGPAFQQAQLTAEAQKVIDAFTLLTKSGADVGGVLVGMKDEINKIVNDSIQFGTTIPANMKPMIEELIRTGQLTDKNGDKFTDLTKIKFGERVKTEYEKISGAIETILTAMNDLIGKIDSLVSAIDAATRPRTLTVTAEYIDPGAPPGFGSVERRGGDNAQAEEGFASGTMGRYGRWFANFGSGTKTTLHGNEAVVRSDQAAAFAADMAGGDNAAMASEIAGLRADINSMLPRAIGRAVRDAMQTSGAMA